MNPLIRESVRACFNAPSLETHDIPAEVDLSCIWMDGLVDLPLSDLSQNSTFVVGDPSRDNFTPIAGIHSTCSFEPTLIERDNEYNNNSKKLATVQCSRVRFTSIDGVVGPPLSPLVTNDATYAIKSNDGRENIPPVHLLASRLQSAQKRNANQRAGSTRPTRLMSLRSRRRLLAATVFDESDMQLSLGNSTNLDPIHSNTTSPLGVQSQCTTLLNVS
ncbi:hypothetical protein CRM22_010988, partial [Opisthorchis felineus]